MLSRQVWAGIAAGAGLGLLGAGIAVGTWWQVDGRYQPKPVAGDAAGLGALLAGAPAVSLAEGVRPVYVIGTRDSGGFEQWANAEVYELAAKGRGVKVVVVPSGYGGAAEDNTVAQLWLYPERKTLEDWLQPRAAMWTAQGIPSMRSDVNRQAALMKARTFAEQISEKASISGWPLVVWQDAAGNWIVCRCDSAKANARARAALGLGQRHQPFTPQENTALPARTSVAGSQQEVTTHPYPVGVTVLDGELVPRDLQDVPVPVPDTALAVPGADAVPRVERPVTPSPSLPGDARETSRPQAAQSTEVRPAARTSSSGPRPRVVNTERPQAVKDEEALFY